MHFLCLSFGRKIHQINADYGKQNWILMARFGNQSSLNFVNILGVILVDFSWHLFSSFHSHHKYSLLVSITFAEDDFEVEIFKEASDNTQTTEQVFFYAPCLVALKQDFKHYFMHLNFSISTLLNIFSTHPHTHILFFMTINVVDVNISKNILRFHPRCSLVQQ